MLLVPSRVPAQQWSAEEREVWQALEQCTARSVQKDIQGVLACTHDNFTGWWSEDLVPRTKNTTRTFAPIDYEDNTVRAYELRPTAIRVFGNCAIVHYYLQAAVRGKDGKDTTYRVRWTDVMLKEGGRWRWIGDAGGPASTSRE
jgi:ketosteroid isomerase-like protein